MSSMAQTRPRNGDGFTLVEALVSLLILTVSLAGSMALMTNLMRANAFGTRMTTAVTLAQDLIDDLSDERYSDITSGSDTVSMYQRSWTVSEVGSTKTLDVAVTWSSVDNQTRQFNLSTIIDDQL